MPATHFQQMIAAIPAVTPTAQSRKHHSEKPVRYAGPFELFGLEHLITACVGARDVFKHCLDLPLSMRGSPLAFGSHPRCTKG